MDILLLSVQKVIRKHGLFCFSAQCPHTAFLLYNWVGFLTLKGAIFFHFPPYFTLQLLKLSELSLPFPVVPRWKQVEQRGRKQELEDQEKSGQEMNCCTRTTTWRRGKCCGFVTAKPRGVIRSVLTSQWTLCFTDMEMMTMLFPPPLSFLTAFKINAGD